MGNIYLIRHGFTPANNANYNGQTGLSKIASDKDMPLEKIYGEAQALEVGGFFGSLNGKTKIFVSPYYRTRQTLDLALSKMEGNFDIEVCDELHENNSGVHYARTKEEVLEAYPEAIKYYDGIVDDPFGTPFTYGESYYDVRDRVKDVTFKIVEASKYYDNVLVFAHGCVNRWIYYWINGEIFMRSMYNGEVIMASGDDAGKTVFMPKAFAPKGFMIDVDSYSFIC